MPVQHLRNGRVTTTNTSKIDNLKATTDLSEPDEGWAFVDDNGTEYAIVRNGKVYPRPVIDGDTSSN